MPLRIGTPLPDLSGATAWINGEPDPGQFVGKPVLVHFWAVSCHICHENMPTLRAWQERYASQGLQLVGVHMPRQESDLEIARVQEDVARLKITEPCAIDNAHAIAEAFQNEYVPAYFLFDREGKMRSRAAGYAGLAMLEGALKRQFEMAEVTG
ncbi:MAG TPA: TlpA disulfide reductase family protein [Chthonomonadales bacterium]|nr:TlpA disulfide reductase family protein [Chthonomonadales bacterium]